MGKHENPGPINRLGAEKSPYLLQHASNPVAWYPWGHDAFERAQNEDKPVFLSIGYSTCHWCHVMAHESFEDPEVAALLNDSFISVKVDREERPDIDSVYMLACQVMTGQGGWPLTIFMTSDKRPFYAGTYFPKNSRLGKMGLIDLLPRVRELWDNRRKELLQSAQQLTSALQGAVSSRTNGHLEENVLRAAFEELSASFDPQHGGFSDAPKFPISHNILFLLRYGNRCQEPRATEMVVKTLDMMQRGGIHDHLGHGFHRYSTDSEWLVPHFEKTLYDQALLAIAYVEGYLATGKTDYAEVARDTLHYCMQELLSPEGGFYCGEDADSDGEEGKFYLWKKDELDAALGKEEGGRFANLFNVTDSGNFEDESSGGGNGGRNILHLKKSLDDLARETGLSPEVLKTRVESARRELFGRRKGKPHPHKDDKILADWNGLMIAALSKAYCALGEPVFLSAAGKTADFFLTKMVTEGRLFHRFRKRERAVSGLLDDYAFLIWGLMELYEASFEPKYLSSSLELCETVWRHFWDPVSGGFFISPDDGEGLIIRQKEIHDGALPSGNSVMLLNLLRMARFSGNNYWEERGNALVTSFAGRIAENPSSYTFFLAAFEFLLGPTSEIVVVCKSPIEAQEMIARLRRAYLPRTVVLLKHDENGGLENIASFTRHFTAISGAATAYVCRDFTCDTATMDADTMIRRASDRNGD